MTPITTHVLDVARGRPAAGVTVVLERRNGSDWTRAGTAVTGRDGRAQPLPPDGAVLGPGEYRLTFDTRAYFEAQAVKTLYPSVMIHFEVSAADPHYHLPLLLSPFGYTTYRGS